MKNMSKHEIDAMVGHLFDDNTSCKTREQVERWLGDGYTETQRERIWRRYQYLAKYRSHNP